MCDPISAGAAVLSAGSMLANSSAQDQVSSARSGVLSAEAGRQQGFNTEANNLNTASANGYDNTTGKMADRAMSVAKFYGSQNGGLPTSGPTAGTIPASSSNIVNSESKAQQGKVAAFNDQQNTALGQLRSFGDILGGADRNTALNTANVGNINSMKQGDAALTPLLLENANNAGNGMKMFGDILGGLGKVGLYAGLSGAGKGLFAKPISGSAASSTISDGIV